MRSIVGLVQEVGTLDFLCNLKAFGYRRHLAVDIIPKRGGKAVCLYTGRSGFEWTFRFS